MTSGRPRNAAATKKRLLAAAAAEFARYGIAGARVDRLAAEAQSNKAQIYHYYGSKDGLFDAVLEALVGQVLAEVPINAYDLPAYAGLLFDGYERHPDAARLATWYRLERGNSKAPVQAVVDAHAAKAAAIAAAQDAGAVTSAYSAEVLLGLVIHTAALWTAQAPEYDSLVSALTDERRRSIVVSAVRALTAPRHGSEGQGPYRNGSENRCSRPDGCTFAARSGQRGEDEMKAAPPAGRHPCVPPA
ncbi:TetR family transcriptional regulator [Streptomyces sp. NPDC059568]|uniref:TetR family transcriptional regulator n=1 Tax=Streptomyces sp. NPDC059568 TaxID=3346868 RepID=UPI003674C643